MAGSGRRDGDLLAAPEKPARRYLEETQATVAAGAGSPGERALRDIAARPNNGT
jgi:hypothetical protein